MVEEICHTLQGRSNNRQASKQAEKRRKKDGWISISKLIDSAVVSRVDIYMNNRNARGASNEIDIHEEEQKNHLTIGRR